MQEVCDTPLTSQLLEWLIFVHNTLGLLHLGSAAARWQSSLGSVAKGSLFSKAQSLGATRAMTTAVAAAGMAGGQAMQNLRPALQIMQSTGVARILGPSHQVELDWNQAATVDIPIEFVREVRLMGIRAD